MKYKDRKHIKEPKQKRKRGKIRITKEDIRIRRCRICSNQLPSNNFQDYCASCIGKFSEEHLCYYCKKIFPSYLIFSKHNCDKQRDAIKGDPDQEMIKQGIDTFFYTLNKSEQGKIINGVKTGKEVNISKTIELTEEE